MTDTGRIWCGCAVIVLRLCGLLDISAHGVYVQASPCEKRETSLGVSAVTTKNQSFVIRIWLEEEDEGSGQAIWRGHITHVPSKERRHFNDLSALMDILGSYLDALANDLDEDGPIFPTVHEA